VIIATVPSRPWVHDGYFTMIVVGWFEPERWLPFSRVY
jgi:hypothetical protein